MTEPTTEAGREWLASIERNGGPSQRARERIIAIEAEAVIAALNSDKAERVLAVALHGYRLDDVPGHGDANGDCESCSKHLPAILAALREGLAPKP